MDTPSRSSYPSYSAKILWASPPGVKPGAWTKQIQRVTTVPRRDVARCVFWRHLVIIMPKLVVHNRQQSRLLPKILPKVFQKIVYTLYVLYYPVLFYIIHERISIIYLVYTRSDFLWLAAVPAVAVREHRLESMVRCLIPDRSF